MKKLSCKIAICLVFLFIQLTTQPSCFIGGSKACGQGPNGIQSSCPDGLYCIQGWCLPEKFLDLADGSVADQTTPLDTTSDKVEPQPDPAQKEQVSEKGVNPEPTPERAPEPTPESTPEPLNCPNACQVGATRNCYPDGTAGCGNDKQNCVGSCKVGTETCNQLQGECPKWSKCEGAVTPKPEFCDKQDNDCDGTTDEIFWSLAIPVRTKTNTVTNTITSDVLGNIYTVINADGQIDIGSYKGPTAKNTTIAKITPGGSVEWVASIETTAPGDLRVSGIAVDSKGFVYISGRTGTSLKFSPTSPLVSDTHTFTEGQLFLAHINPKGQFEAPIFGMGSKLSPEGLGGSLVIDKQDNIYHSRTFKGKLEIALAGSQKKSLSANKLSGFIAKYTAQFSKLEWLNKLSSTGIWFGPGTTTSPKNSNALFATASFQGQLSYTNNTPQITSKGELDLLVSKLATATGDLDWHFSIGALNTIVVGLVPPLQSDLTILGIVQVKPNSPGAKTVAFPGPNGKNFTLQVSDQTNFQSFVGLLDKTKSPPHFQWLNTVRPPQGKQAPITGLAQSSNGTMAAIIELDDGEYQVGAIKVTSTAKSILVALIDHKTGKFTKTFLATSTSTEPIRSHGIVYDEKQDIFHIMGSFTKDVTIGGKTFTHPTTHQRAFFIANFKPDGTWECKP